MQLIKSFSYGLLIIGLVLFLSIISVRIQGQSTEGESHRTLVYSDTLTIGQFGTINNIPNQKLSEFFHMTNKTDRLKRLYETGIPTEQIKNHFTALLTIKSEYETRNWIKIPLKFGVTIIVLIAVFILLQKGKIDVKLRYVILGISVFIFGVFFGSDPNPMGTVKDAIVLYGTKQVIFPPRLIAFVIFMTLVILANKFICSWACQFGTLQDLLFRVFQKKGSLGILQLRIPFALSNAIRILFFIVFSFFVFVFKKDSIAHIDPFKAFNPLLLGTAGSVVLGMLFLTSFFIYRPWCHFFCPFGLVGWIAEKISIYKIIVDYSKCIACKKCENTCPSTVMSTILRQNRVSADCFSCGSCIEVCPTKSIAFKKGKRKKPPHDKFL